MSTQVNTSAVVTKEKNPIVEYDVAGEKIKLSFQIIRDYLTKGNGSVTDPDLMLFMSICKFNKLNPFLNEAHLIKYGAQPAQIVVSKEAFMKRAEANENYEGIRAGLIILRNNEIKEFEGNFYLKDDEILGAWAEVYRRDRKFPVIAKVSLSEYDKKQPTWNEKKATMIAKVAKVQALREAFPAQLGAMYTQEEQQNVIDISHREVVDKEVINQPDPSETEQPTQVAPQQQKQINFDDL